MHKKRSETEEKSSSLRTAERTKSAEREKVIYKLKNSKDYVNNADAKYQTVFASAFCIYINRIDCKIDDKRKGSLHCHLISKDAPRQ